MGTRDEGRRQRDAAGSPVDDRDGSGEDSISVEVDDDLTVTVGDAAVDDDGAGAGDDDDGGSGGDVTVPEADASSGVGLDEAADGSADGEASDVPLGFTAVRLPARGRRRGRPGTIF